MERYINHPLTRKYLRHLIAILLALVATCVFLELAGCLPHRAPQKLAKAVKIKLAPRTAALVKQLPQTPIERHVYLPFLRQTQLPDLPTHPPSPPPEAPVPSPSSLKVLGIDFGNQEDWVRIKIYPKDQKVNNGQPIILKFIPGDHCIFGDQHACVASFQSSEGTPVIWLTIHSGVGGEGQPFRNAVEGTGINSAAYSLQKISANLQDLSDSRVAISQGTTTARDLRLQVTARIPGSLLQGYFNTPLEDTLDFSAQVAPGLQPLSRSKQPLIVFETCGWRVPGQPWFPSTTATSASVYLGVIEPTY
jgi:hypothetical protein